MNQFLGDGIMALFGVPAAYEDHARRAGRAALGIRVLGSRRAACEGSAAGAVKVRMGLNTGQVAGGRLGDALAGLHGGRRHHQRGRSPAAAAAAGVHRGQRGHGPAVAATSSRAARLGGGQGRSARVKTVGVTGARPGARRRCRGCTRRPPPRRPGAGPRGARATASTRLRRARPGGRIVGEPGIGKSPLRSSAAPWATRG